VEKPYVFIDSAGLYHVFVPSLTELHGHLVGQRTDAGSRPLADAHLLRHPAGRHGRDHERALANGLNLLITPGFYQLKPDATVTHPKHHRPGMGWPLSPERHHRDSTADVGGVQSTTC